MMFIHITKIFKFIIKIKIHNTPTVVNKIKKYRVVNILCQMDDSTLPINYNDLVLPRTQNFQKKK